jgi:energy-coupling factor transport system substrate-specific component
MSWAGESLLVLLAALAAGFAWYERSKPSSRTLALVATLAALAALGRIAFAALPDIKPTTDIVLITGYALGGPPGFAVGAVAALTSNLFFTEGAWTPWQMFAWGLAGLVGAALARATGRSLNRWTLALACAAMGILFGLIMNLFTWTQTGPFTLAGYFVIEGRALPFDIAHAVGNAVFALAFGPALISSLARFRSRLEVVWLPARATATGAAVAVVLALALAGVASGLSHPPRAAAAATRDATVARTTSYLLSAQNSDGGFGAAPHGQSTSLYSAWAVLGLAAAGRSPGHSAAQYLSSSLAANPGEGDLERTMLALAAAGSSLTHAGARNLVSELEHMAAPDGSFSHQVNLTAFAILALRAGGVGPSASVLRRATAWLSRQQNADGGFDFATRGGQSGIDDTAAPVEALAAAGQRSSRSVSRAAGFLAARQNADGGFPLSPGSDSNAQSTAFAIQGLIAAGRNPDALHHGGSRSPPAYLRSLVGPDGSVRYSRISAQTPVWVTGQALAALARRPLPIAAPPRPRSTSGTSAPASASAARSRPRSTARSRAAVALAQRARGHALRVRALLVAHEAGVITGLLLPSNQ